MSFRLPDGFVDEVRAAASIVAVVGGHVSLKKAGRTWKGLCPFHTEKTPSFNVDEEKGFFHCFGCDTGGDVFKFVMLAEKVGFPEAVRKVAELSGVPLPRQEPRPGDDRRERLYELNERALAIYRAALARPSASAARDYLAKRGIAPETIERFEIGVAPEGWDGVCGPLQREGAKPADLVAVGLAKERPSGRGVYDRFHDRVVFPIRNVGSRLVGFGGRSLGGQEPKYLNSPETEIYVKSEVLFGLNLAKDAIRQAGHAVLVEGYLDLVSLHQAGVGEAVASLGTSLTERHARLLKRFAPRVFVSYDGDTAGRNAARRAVRALVPERLEVAVVEIPGGLDPDDLVRAEGGDAFRKLLASARGFVPYLVAIAREADPSGGRTPDGRLRIVNEVLPVLAGVENPVDREVYAGALAEAVGISDAVAREAVRKAVSERRDAVGAGPAPGLAARTPPLEAEIVLVAALLDGRESYERLAEHLDPEDWRELAAGRLLDRLLESHRRGTVPQAGAITDALEEAADREVLGRVVVEGREPGPRAAEGALRTLKARRIRAQIEEIQRSIGTAGADDLDRMLERKQELSRLLDGIANTE